MKCIKNQKTGEVRRVANEAAYEMETKGWAYVPKSEWKAATRQPSVEVAEKVVKERKVKKVGSRVGKSKKVS